MSTLIKLTKTTTKFFCSTAIALTCVSFQTFAADAFKVAICDAQKIVQNSAAGQGLQTQVDAEQQKFGMQVQKAQAEIEKMRKSLETKKKHLSQEAIKAQNTAMQKKLESFQRDAMVERSVIDKTAESGVIEVNTRLLDIINTKAKAENYSVVIDKSSLLYGESSLDITDEILKSLNQALPTVKLDFEKTRKELESAREKFLNQQRNNVAKKVTKK